MKVHHYTHPKLQYYTGFETGYIIGDIYDVYNPDKIIIRKIFAIKNVKYMISCNPGSGLIRITKHQNGNTFMQTLSTATIDIKGFMPNVCDAIKAFDVCKS